MFRTITTAILFALTITSVQAAPVTVRFGDLDLSRPADSRILTSRVQAAAEAVCAEWQPPMGGVQSWAFYNLTHENCLRVTTQGVMSDIMASAAAHAPRVASN